jgi:hypothetical protein
VHLVRLYAYVNCFYHILFINDMFQLPCSDHQQDNLQD